jgi:hypothetical protein
LFYIEKWDMEDLKTRSGRVKKKKKKKKE